MNQKTVNPDLLANFHAPKFPGSYFISLEGIEGAGKSCQIIRLKNYLEERKFRVLLVREPGGTVFGEKLRQAILEGKTPLHPVAEAALFAASRAQLLHEVILKELANPQTIIICDRYIDSGLSYQGFARKLGLPYLLNIHNCYPLNLFPHLTLLIEIDLATSYQRQKKRNASKDYFESQNDQFYRDLIEGYKEIAKLFPQRIFTVDGLKDEVTVFASIKKRVDQLLLT